MRSHDLVEVLGNRFRAIADEMALSIHRTAFSVYVKETRDFAAGLCTKDGEVFGFPSIAPPMMLGSDASVVIGSMRDLQAGDIVATNDPVSSGAWMTHLNDVHLLKPLFHRGEIQFYLWAFLHLSDVGGRVPGSISAANRSLDEEGFRVAPAKLYRAGELDIATSEAFQRESRTPDLNRGDINALVAALNKGEQRSVELLDRYGAAAIAGGVEGLLAYGERKARAVIGALKPGTYIFTDYVEVQDPSIPPVPISVAATVDGSSLSLDFEGSGSQIPAAYNLMTHGRRHSDLIYGVINFLRSADPTMPANAGILRPVTVRTPEGSILNARAGAAIGARMGVVVRTMEAIYGALGQASDVLPAASGDRSLVFLTAPEPDGGTRVSLLQPVVGGSGARARRDGIDGIDAAVAWLRNVPTEALELEMPVLVHSYRLAPGHAAGAFRGGRGTEFEFETLVDGCRVIARNRSRRVFRPWGRDGGEPGGHSRVWLNPGTGEERYYEVIDIIELRRGDTLRFVSGYGGAFGPPLERDPLSVRNDVRERVLSAASARNKYGVELADDDARVDQAATTTIRAIARGSVVSSDDSHSVGIERLLHDVGLPPEFAEGLRRLVEGVPEWSEFFVERSIRLLFRREELVSAAKVGDQVAVAELLRGLSEIRANLLELFGTATGRH